jgi:predicted RND superfamily exporter protein
LNGDVTSAVKRTGGAVALCSYTTTIGYGSMLFADFQSLQSFGKLAMSGEIACIAGALLVLPAMLHILRRWRGEESPRGKRSEPGGPTSVRPAKATSQPPA